ncbi:Carbohydrate family 9 binding domain-like [Verrucomicrobium sp. GAS474]|uniref:sugar-binding protein n=1 Tax=Verrucomicrobium sp. GAS474 TaxID=1882831 RepID=UPI00087D33C8|nr:sugar-binding protein [Verrucomicrobium sp. GAS474]SDT95096.1 Carbohydrate family 9 binding domain-like [Verrucomicrobium sp. GAS474]
MQASARPASPLSPLRRGLGAALLLASPFFPLLPARAALDAFGQPVAGAWPGKVATEAELRADIGADRAYHDALASRARPTLDAFGGLPGSGAKLGLAANGFFHTEKKGNRWLLVDPLGNAYFHLGVCGVAIGDTYTVTKGREGDFAWLPPADGADRYPSAWREGNPGVFSFYLANEIRKFDHPHDPAEFEVRMIDWLRQWGFNAIGAFSPLPPAVQAQAMPYVAHLPLDPGTAGIPALPGIPGAWDPFEAANRERIDRSFAKSVAARRDDPLLVGWFLANEPLYEDLPKVIPALKADHACKRELVAFLREKYGTLAAFNAAWGMAAPSFDALGDTALPASTRAAFDDLHAFTGRFEEAYYRLVAETFHRYDSRHLLLGSRFQPGTINDEQLCRIAGKYVDVMSFNYYTDAVDGDLLKRIAGWAGKPLLLSEFYWASDADSGLSGGRSVSSQRERGLAYRNYVEQAAALGCVVGVEWFQLIDEAASGRWFEGPGGERANCGLLGVTGRPYKEALAPMIETNDAIYAVWLDGKKPFAFDNPRFSTAGGDTKTTTAPRATGPVRVDGTTKNWPGIPPEIVPASRLVQGVVVNGQTFAATFKLCWDDANLYLLADVTDPTPMRNGYGQKGAALWLGDGLEIFLGTEEVGAGGPLRFTDRHLLVGATGPGKAAVHFAGRTAEQQTPVEAVVVPGGSGCTIEAAIPWAALGLASPPRPGIEFRFDLGVNDSADGRNRRAQLMWNGTDKNSGDRTRWGRLKLLP